MQVLPCVLAFIDGISVDRIVGFEGLGRSADMFTTRDLEARLLRANVLARAKIANEDGSQYAQTGGKTKNAAKVEDDDDDWD